jgi:hypothetical protein
MLLVIYTVVHNGNKYSHGRVKIFNLLNILLYEILGPRPAFKLTVFFSNANIYLLLDEQPKKLFHVALGSEKRQNKSI